jgi:HlyD family secretion protein
MNKLLQIISDTITAAIESGDYDADSIAEKCGDAVADAIQKGVIDETTLIVESGVAVDMVEAAVKSINWEEIVSNMENTDTVQLTSAQLQLAALYAEKEIFTAAADSSLSEAQKQVMNTTKSALDVLKESQAELAEGWVASIDGTVTECNVVAGAQTTALETGIKIENMDSMVVTISLGEYDVHKVKVGMSATITTAYGTYSGEIATIAPTATGGSEGSILDSVGSMAGISGLSSLTSSGAGVECTVTVDNPDENIIIGFDASVEIQTGSYTDVPTVPIESIVLEKDGKYVYLYNEEDETVTKTEIETGSASDTAYEVTSGIKVGDKIVATPASDYEEDTFKVRIK